METNGLTGNLPPSSTTHTKATLLNKKVNRMLLFVLIVLLNGNGPMISNFAISQTNSEFLGKQISYHWQNDIIMIHIWAVYVVCNIVRVEFLDIA